MESGEYDSVLNFLFSDKQANIKRKGNKEYKKVIINDVEYPYNKEKPLVKKLKSKLEQVSKTPQYRRFKILDKASKGILVRNALKKYAIIQKATITDEQSALKSYANTYSISNIKLPHMKGLSYFIHQKDKLNEYLKKHKSMKVIAFVEIAFDDIETEDEIIHSIKSRRYNIFNEDDLINALNNMGKDIEITVAEKQIERSGLRIKKIHKITIHYDKYDPTRAGKYFELPEWIMRKKACINIKNDDDMCFRYCVLCKFYEIFKKDHPQRMYHYKKYIEEDNFIKWNDMNYPVCNDDIDHFEEINGRTISINVYTIDEEKKTIRPDRITKVSKPVCHVNLLRIDHDDVFNHYVLIKDYSRLMSSQTNNHREKLFHCMYCQKGFQQETLLTNHITKGCLANEVQSTQMPKEHEKMQFKNHYKKLKAPYVIYGDFECLTAKSDEGIKGTYANDSEPMRLKGAYQHHQPSGFMLNVVNSITNEMTPYLYRGEDCMNKFCDTMNKIREDVFDKMADVEPLDPTDEEEAQFEKATRCFICNQKFSESKNQTKVRDHCHFTGQYRGAAHVKCNLDFCFRYFKIPVFFHNLKNYDAHLIISNLEKLNTKKDQLSVIAQNSEKFVTFELKQLQFKDSFSFLSSSLDKLVKLTKYEGNEKRTNWQENFKYSRTSKYIKSDECLDLLSDKGVYPYDYFDNFNKFNEKELPPIEEFYSKLSEEHIKQEEYERAQKIYKHFNIQNLGEYHDLYLQTDVLLLTDVFENFRTKCLEDYQLDPAHYFTLPNFAWDAMLLKTGIKLDLIYDEEIYKMVEKGLRGGMCQVSHRKAEANNKYMEELYDETKPSSYINYLDANNLYGLAMCQKLPYKDIRWIQRQFTEDDIKNYSDLSTGYILDVDLEYPKELHDKHSDYPLAPEIMNVTADMLSEAQKEIYRKTYTKTYKNGEVVGLDPKDEKTKKLILNVNDKSNYVLHINILRYYLKQGLKLKKVNRVIEFKQKQWLKPWIDFNTDKRKQATSDFEKDMYKLMNNAVYGKTMENVREHINFELVDTPERFQKCVNNPTYKHRHIINENLVGVEKLKETVKLNKPIYVGMSILDLSKLHMYSFYYDVLKQRYKENINLIYTDTDSFVIHTKTEDIYDDFKELSKHMDFSGYDKNHNCYDPTNKKVLGKFKDECDGKIMTHFIGLKPKSYAFRIFKEDKEEKKSKGIVKHKVKKELTFKKYEQTLETTQSDKVSFNSIRSKNHQIYTINQIKQSLSSYDNKRYYLDSVKSLPFGHFSIK